jgi:hypothetical protein
MTIKLTVSAHANTFIIGQYTIQLESAMSISRLRLYVKSVKTITGTAEVMHARLRESHAVEIEPMHDYVLTEDQQKVVEIVREIARRHNLEVEIVDVTRENILHRVIQEEREKIRAFPALLADSGERIEGNISEEQAESFLSRIADGSHKKYL